MCSPTYTLQIFYPVLRPRYYIKIGVDFAFEALSAFNKYVISRFFWEKCLFIHRVTSGKILHNVYKGAAATPTHSVYLKIFETIC